MAIKKQLNILINMAISDQDFAEREMNFIYQIGRVNGLSDDEVKEMIENPQPIADLDTLSEDERFDYLFNLTQLMKMDGKVFKSEIVFCQEMAVRLGFKKGVVADLSTKIFGDPSVTTERALLKKIALKYKS